MKTETFARTKAETIAKVLKDTLETQNATKDCMMDVDPAREVETEDANVETEDDGEWTKPKRKQKKKSKTGQDTQTSQDNCDSSDNICNAQSDLAKHKDKQVKKDLHQCSKCEKAFQDKIHLQKHEQIHIKVDTNNCSVRGENSNEKSHLNEQGKTHAREILFKCKLCEKEYTDMAKLRRHDWRSHRETACNICEDMIESRQQIGNHRQTKHQIFKKVLCRFYPSCLDGDECFFVHE